MATVSEQIQQIYVGLLGRAADKAGLDYWLNDIANNGMTIENLRANITNSQAEYTDGKGAMTRADLVESLYQDMFERASDAAGKEYWVTGAGKDVNADQLVLALTNGAQGDDVTALANKVKAAEYYTAKAADKYSADSAKAAVDTVDATDASVTASTSATDAAFPVAGQAFTLTTNADLITATGSDDTINGLVGTNTANGTLTDTAQSVDIIDGGAGADTLNLQLTSGAAAFAAKVANVETVNYTDFSGVGYNMANSADVTTLNIANSVASSNVTNAAQLLDLSVTDINKQTVSIGYDAAAVNSNTDVQKITVDGYVTAAAGATNLDFNDADIESFEIEAKGSKSAIRLEDANATATKVVVTGSADLDLSFSDDTSADADTTILKTIDASAFTGDLTLEADAEFGALDQTITTGTGADKVTIGNLTKDDTVDLGEGADTLTVNFTTDTTVTTAPTFTNVETLALVATGADTDVTLNLSKSASLTALNVGIDDGADGDSVSVTKAAASLQTINLKAGGVTADAVMDSVSFALATATGSSDELTLNYTNTDANGNHVDAGKGTQITSAVVANNMESISVNTAVLGADTKSTVQDGGLALNLVASKVQTLTLASETLLDLSGVNLDNSIRTVDASAANGGVLLELDVAADEDNSVTADKSVSVTTGAGNDTVNDILGAVATTVSTGAGNDTIATAGAAGNATIAKKLTIDAGAGNDKVDLGGEGGTVAKAITLGDGTDTLVVEDMFSAGAGDNVTTNITVADFVVGAAGDKLDFVSNSASGTGVTATTYKEITLDVDNSDTGGHVSLTSGMNIISTDDGTTAASLTEADVATFLAAGTNDILANNADNVFYFAVTDGTDTGIYLFEGAEGANATTAIQADDIDLLVTLTGVDTPSGLTVDNFADFLV
ncbi:DUF4214 domain-containing protein [Pontibacterium sp. N1Y112]|uniref:DUF4214 domain-containing protein n=1 Tax=Pontibacterium sinense TaxID=2781979 RepID=A0A8J7FAB0_9GAMM|nr:DUF4214 domain-containing protein [Pontibacterium sinense]MBE9395946.1 DUF4214 domain-containing protein [Pontibacterium sinense]